MANNGLTITASVQPKNGKLYAVMQYKIDGKRYTKWRSLYLPVEACKAKINQALRQTTNAFQAELEKEISQIAKGPAGTPVLPYMKSWFAVAQKRLQINTITSYQQMIDGRITRYFGDNPSITIGNITVKQIHDFYQTIYDDGMVSNTVIHYHALLRKAFQQACKDEILPSNPFDRIERPKKVKYQGKHLSEEDWKHLLTYAKSDPIYPAIMLAGGMGLRRSEAVGVRWSRIDWAAQTVLLDTKIVEASLNGKRILRAVEEMKNASSNRTLPIPNMVFEMLQEQREKQTVYKELFRKSYSDKFTDYVCVNELGDLLKPSYVTTHFGKLLKHLGMEPIRFHDLRHTFASILINKDVPLINVSNFLGHSDIATTANIYAHLDKASKQKSAQIISDLFDET